MRKHLFLLLAFIVSACAPKQDPAAQQIQQSQQSIAATLTALAVSPQNTPVPISTPIPTPTIFDLAGLYCEYQFCMGHPIDMAYFDVNAKTNAASPSTYSQGLIAAFNPNLFIQMTWQLAPGSTDPQFMLDLILDEGIDTRLGTLDVKLIRDMNVIFSPITSTASPVLPYGGAAAWICGERAFAWKIYTPQAESAQPLFEEAFTRFTCKK
jgi:hypothetical protein